MAKLKIIIIAVVACIFAASISANIILLKENSRKNKQLESFEISLQSLSDSFSEVSKQKTYSISLAPNIVNKNTAAFGKVANVTLHYYFSMDGNKIELLPDSVKTIVSGKDKR
jgi:myo-inositol-hexaphosphate 3-phosphohydrolase